MNSKRAARGSLLWPAVLMASVALVLVLSGCGAPPEEAPRTGHLDPSFHASGAGANGPVRAIAQQPDGNLLIAGDFTSYDAEAVPRLARLNEDGSRDEAFQPVIELSIANSIYTHTFSSIVAMRLQRDGKVVVAGPLINTFDGYFSHRSAVIRIGADGVVDPGFAMATFTDDAWSTSVVQALELQDDGRILVGGIFTKCNDISHQRLVRLNPDGTVDGAFPAGGQGADGAIDSIAFLRDGRIMIGGAFLSYNAASSISVARLNDDGSLDTSFLSGAARYRSVRSLVEQDDGKILVAGDLMTSDGSLRGGVIRLNVDGSIDTTFVYTGAGANDATYAQALNSTGLLVGGNFTTYNGVSYVGLAHLDANGNTDTAFPSPDAPWNRPVYAICVQDDGKIVLGGAFTSYNRTSQSYLVRLLD